MVEIRRASIDDEEQVFSLFARLVSRQRENEWAVVQSTGVSTFRKIFLNPDLGVVLVAAENCAVLGVICLSYPVAIRCSGKYARIEEFIVGERSRGKGVGSRLLAATVSEATLIGCFDMNVNNPSDLGKPLYLKQSFVEGGDYMKLKLLKTE